ncbi:tetraspanin-33 isoform X1 [Xyrichtys novacula]|uniref:Tetraspanin n=1 Tax=Xyrichtys novacula TaxID=13765 RepID=A0AAV1F1E4_XYRNO|nr:tetraspanin-33 isoform X1 [Xyrichtys novacula]
MAGGRRGISPSEESCPYARLIVKYMLFVFCFIYWVTALVMVSIGVYAHKMKHAETALASLSVDPAMMLMVVGVFIFILNFCGWVGSLRENICLLQTFCISLIVIFVLQLVAGVLGFVFSDKAREKLTGIIDNAIVHYRDDIDLQNLIDFAQGEFGCCGSVSYVDWSQNMYFQCDKNNPSQERCSVPYSCCVITKQKEVINTMCGKDMQNYEYGQAGSFIYTSGCIDKMSDWIHSNMFLLGGVALGLALPQLVGIVLSQILINMISSAE